jgi:tetratricopeptide (TPR) repeat protein
MHPLPDPAAQHFEQGVSLLRTGRLEVAEPHFRAALALRPGWPEANGTLGAILGALGRHNEAEAYLRQALRLRPDSADAHGNLGNLLRELGRGEEAEACLRQAIRLRPHYPEAFNNLGALLKERGEATGAIAAFRAALRQNPGFTLARANLASALLQGNALEDAEALFRAILHAMPGDLAARLGLAEALRRRNRLAEAEPLLRTLLDAQPDCREAWAELGNTLLAAGRPAEAAPCFRSARALGPAWAEAELGLGIAEAGLGRHEAAEGHFRAALALKPHLAAAHNSLGDTLRSRKQFAAAEASLRQALRLAPGLAEAQVNLAFTLLQTGREAEGWRAYEHRWLAAPWVHQPRSLPAPLWEGQDLSGQSILLRAEQGLGDTLQFARYAARLPPAARVLLQVQRPLVGLLARMPGLAGVHALEDTPPATDWYCDLLSLPHRLGRGGMAQPYLAADPARVASWKARLRHLPGLRVGLAWAGNPAMAADARRSIPLPLLDRLAEIPGVSFLSLQRGAAAEAPSRLRLERPAMEGDGFEDTAALVMALDLVISVDTAVLHLAGGLGQPAWLLNRHDQCWRWPEEPDDARWYPHLREFRQPSPGDWDSVLNAVAEALSQRAGSRPEHETRLRFVQM